MNERAILAPLAIIAAIVIFGLLMLGRNTTPLHLSPVGYAALAPWLTENGQEAQFFRGGFELPPDRFSLRVLPLYDFDLTTFRPQDDQNETAPDATELQLTPYSFSEKIDRLPSLVVLPKWQNTMRLTRSAHPELRVPPQDYATLLAQIGLDGAELIANTGPERFHAPSAGLELLLHDPHLLKTDHCTPFLGDQSGMLLGYCESEDFVPFWILSDPDLLSNHGLSQGDNAAAAVQIIEIVMDGDGEVLVDTSVDVWVSRFQESGSDRERNWEDLARYFAFPFSLLWLGAAVGIALLLWRGLIREAPAERDADSAALPGSEPVVAARARLMQLAPEPQALLADYVAARFDNEVVRIWGLSRPEGDSETLYLQRLVQRSPVLSERLNSALDEMRRGATQWGAEDITRFSDEFETALERARHAA